MIFSTRIKLGRFKHHRHFSRRMKKYDCIYTKKSTWQAISHSNKKNECFIRVLYSNVHEYSSYVLKCLMLNWFILNTSSLDSEISDPNRIRFGSGNKAYPRRSRAGPWFNYKSPTVTLPLPTGRSLFLVIGKLVWGLLGLGFWLSDRSIYFFPSHQVLDLSSVFSPR